MNTSQAVAPLKGVLIVAVAFLWGCTASTPIDEYYSLVLASDSPAFVEPVAGSQRKLILDSVALPAYLQQAGIVLETENGQVSASTRSFWAEPLDDAITKALKDELSAQDGRLTVSGSDRAWSVKASCSIRFEFDRFHTSEISGTRTSGRFWISDGKAIDKQTFFVARPLKGDGYEFVVRALRGSLTVVVTQALKALMDRPECGFNESSL